MMNFTQWAEASKHNLKAILTDTASPEGRGVTEKTARSGMRAQYPDAYVRSQYPDPYFTPKCASAPVDLQNAKLIRNVSDSGGKAAN